MVNLSPSSLGLFLDCKRCFWLDKMKKIKRPGGPFPSLPSGMDRVLKEHFDWHRKEGTLPEVLRDFKGRLYPDLEKLTAWRNNFKGLRFTQDGNTFFGAIDDLFITPDGKYAPLDFKTRGYPLKEDTHEYYRFQMDCYAFLLERNSLPSAGYAILLFYHPLKVNREHHVEFQADPITIKTNPKAAEKVFQAGIKCLNDGQPKAGEECGFCGWKSKI